jgi:hypothetical protein
MIFIKTLLFLYIQRYRKNTINILIDNSNSLSTIYNKNNTNINHSSGGYDERFPKNEKNLEIERHHIYNLHNKKKLLDILEDKNISITVKQELLQDNSIKTPNLMAGNLFKDFDCEF